ncbi:sensor histidine kinase [Kitasatospora sp. NPDC056138]|uniref:sensor histidine kinase n=1 Tax=Kitasatospora sp. NPDC056138 TaxID=3345724 RepID=UPI0035DF2E74
MDLSRPVRRWRASGKPQRTEAYIRWSVYLTEALQVLMALSAAGTTRDASYPGRLLLVALAVSVLSTTVSIGCFRTTLDHYLGRRQRPTAWLVAAVVTIVAGNTALLLLAPVPGAGELPVTATQAAYTTALGFAGAALALSIRAGVLGAAGVVLLILPAGLLAGVSPATTLGLMFGMTIWLAMLMAAWRCSAWIVSVVWELDAARETQAQLAVAEERLRFSRDLHDVMGRNLTTIALKSELAVQLARRGRPEAAEQMAEVQRIAQESQREVRDVVRGYRAADLQAELTGARSVLRAAQVECTVELAEGTTAMPPAVQSVLGWVIREATTNVLRHSDARYCSIRLRLADGRAVLEIENDGVPTIPKPSTGSGTGLAGLRERLVVLGGELTCGRPGSGRHRLTAALSLTAGSPDTALEASTP